MTPMKRPLHHKQFMISTFSLPVGKKNVMAFCFARLFFFFFVSLTCRNTLQGTLFILTSMFSGKLRASVAVFFPPAACILIELSLTQFMSQFPTPVPFLMRLYSASPLCVRVTHPAWWFRTVPPISSAFRRSDKDGMRSERHLCVRK